MASDTIRPVRKSDRKWIRELIAERWGSERIVTRGTLHAPHELPGYVAMASGKKAGLVTYRIEGEEAEIISLDSLKPGTGIGTALLKAVMDATRKKGATRLKLITTNDNANALRFYQKRGFTITALHPNALAFSRKLKPELPTIGIDNIPLRDEIELERPI
ncbi:MAG: GNAT family N-acetyltransferase [Planctomycetota bacterium]|jgi:DNA-3-methyladenine glycosylase I